MRPALRKWRFANIRKLFRRIGGAEVKAVDDISFDVGDGEMIVLLGPSGCA